MEAKKRPSCFSQSEKSELLFKADSSSRNFSPEIVQVTARISDLEDEIFIATSENTSVSASSSKVFMAVNAVAGRGNEIRTGYKSIGGTGGFELFLKKSPEELSFEAARMAVAMLDAVNAPSGSYPVVIGPAFGGVIFHEACGHGLEADSIIKDASVYKDKIGKKIASTCVTAIDDATLPYHWGSYLFDDEGYNSCRNTLIKDGVLLKYICDYKSSKKLKIDISGNARRQSYKDIPLPRMSNTYIDTGKDKPELIINSVKNGIFAKEFSGGQVDPATGDFVFGISEGYFIKNGTVSDPIKGATLIGNGPEILNKIEAVADDLDFAPGFCGKGGQSVSNEVGQPTLLVSSLTVGGTGI
jgi:TldD protein